MRFWRVITNDRSDIHAKGQGQRSKVKVTDVKTPFSHFWTITPVWIDIWWWNDAQSLVLLRRGAYCFSRSSANFKVTRLKKSLILTQIGRFRTVSPFWIHPRLWNDAQSLKHHRRGVLLFFKVIRQISRSRGTKNRQFWPEFGVSGL